MNKKLLAVIIAIAIIAILLIFLFVILSINKNVDEQKNASVATTASVSSSEETSPAFYDDTDNEEFDYTDINANVEYDGTQVSGRIPQIFDSKYAKVWKSEDGKIIFKTRTSKGINTFDVVRGVYNDNGTKVRIECLLAIANKGVAYEDVHEDSPMVYIYIYIDEDKEILLDGEEIMGGDIKLGNDNKSFVLFNEISNDTYRKGQKIKFYQVSK